MSKEFSWTRKNPKAALWQDGSGWLGEGLDSGIVWSEFAETLAASGLPESPLTVHAGGKGSEHVDQLIVGSISYVHEANCIVLSIPGSSA